MITGIKKSEELQSCKIWFPESGNIKCNCGEIIHISSSIKQHDEKICEKCNLVYEFWNNKDGTGLRFNIKGYHPLYHEGHKFIISKFVK